MATTYQLTKACDELSASGVRGRELERQVGRSKAWISRHLNAWRRASEGLLLAWRDGVVTDDAALRIAALPLDMQAAAIASPPRRPTKARATIADMAALLAKHEGAVGEYSAGVRDALRWALGDAPAIRLSPPSGA